MDEMSIIHQATKEMFDEANSMSSSEAVQPAPTPAEADIYTMRSRARQNASQKPTQRGSSVAMNTYVEDLVNNAKAQYNRAKDAGETEGYNEQVVLPIIEAVVSEYGPDELLNSKKSVDLIDSIILTDNGKGTGYTKSYVKQMYKNAPTERRGGGNDDSEVSSGVRRINALLDDNQIRSGKQLAEKLKKKIDNGELSASEDSYELINRVALN